MITPWRSVLLASVFVGVVLLGGCGAGSDPPGADDPMSKRAVAHAYLAAIRRGDMTAALALASAGSKGFASGFDRELRGEMVREHLSRVSGPVMRDDALVYQLSGTTRHENDTGTVVLIDHDHVTLRLSFESVRGRWRIGEAGMAHTRTFELPKPKP